VGRETAFGGTTVLDLITQVRNLALEAELKGQKSLAAKLHAIADEEEATTSLARSDSQDSGRTAQASDGPSAWPPPRKSADLRVGHQARADEVAIN
jgi:hypothetical protein